jgi:ketosteroid isomerase-like protein
VWFGLALTAVAPDAELQEAIASWDRAFAEGRLDEFSAFFADDAHLLIHHQETLVAKEAIRASFAAIFDQFDTSAFEPRYDVVDVHGDRAYVLASFEEVLEPTA